MVEPTILDYLPLWAFFAVTIAVALAAGDVGYRLGRRRCTAVDSGKKEVVGSIVGAMFGLLAFLLAFTFGLAASRYDTRLELDQDEANAIRSTYFRSYFLPDAHGSKARELLRSYVEVRINADNKVISISEANGQSVSLQKKLWRHGMEVGRELDKPGAPNSDMLALYLDAQGQMIDIHGKRLSALTRARVPAAIWAGLFILTILAILIAGYHVGIAGTSRPIVGVGMIFCLAFTLFLTADLDRPLEGFIQVDHRDMGALRDSMTEETP